MKLNQLQWALLYLIVTAALRLSADQGGADRKLVSELRAEAEKGDAQSQYKMGLAFMLGDLDVAKDAVEAVKWFRRAAEQNHARTQSDLGMCYTSGLGSDRRMPAGGIRFCDPAHAALAGTAVRPAARSFEFSRYSPRASGLERSGRRSCEQAFSGKRSRREIVINKQQSTTSRNMRRG